MIEDLPDRLTRIEREEKVVEVRHWEDVEEHPTPVGLHATGQQGFQTFRILKELSPKDAPELPNEEQRMNMMIAGGILWACKFQPKSTDMEGKS